MRDAPNRLEKKPYVKPRVSTPKLAPQGTKDIIGRSEATSSTRGVIIVRVSPS